MNDPSYAQKYAIGAEQGNLAGKLKQAIDARHTKYLQGWLVSGGAAVKPESDETFGTFELGRELYDESYFTHRISLAGFSNDDAFALGLDAGVRLQAPTRLAPFIGVGAQAGVLIQDAGPLVTEFFERDDPLDDLRIQEEDSVDGLAILYPELGAHFWIDGRIRVTAFGRYQISSQGRDFDDWLVGGQVALFTR